MERGLVDPTIVVRGDVPDQMVAYARKKAMAVATRAPVPVLACELRLDHHADPARERPNHVEITIDLDGVPVRARRSAATMSEAIDRAVARLRRRVEVTIDRPEALHLRHRDPNSWHHDDGHSSRPQYFPRAHETRAVVRRKTYAVGPESIEEALFDLESLDHDFFLFEHDETGADAVGYRTPAAGYGIAQAAPTPEAISRVEVPLETGAPPPTTTEDKAVAVLEETGVPFVFFVDEDSGRGRIAYRRYDGNYGVIRPT
jgi:ribosome-associated translation inhibitor RaiA